MLKLIIVKSTLNIYIHNQIANQMFQLFSRIRDSVMHMMYAIYGKNEFALVAIKINQTHKPQKLFKI